MTLSRLLLGYGWRGIEYRGCQAGAVSLRWQVAGRSLNHAAGCFGERQSLQEPQPYLNELGLMVSVQSALSPLEWRVQAHVSFSCNPAAKAGTISCCILRFGNRSALGILRLERWGSQALTKIASGLKGKHSFPGLGSVD